MLQKYTKYQVKISCIFQIPQINPVKFIQLVVIPEKIETFTFFVCSFLLLAGKLWKLSATPFYGETVEKAPAIYYSGIIYVLLQLWLLNFRGFGVIFIPLI